MHPPFPVRITGEQNVDRTRDRIFSYPAYVSCCWFRGHEDKIVTKELESGYDETEVQP